MTVQPVAAMGLRDLGPPTERIVALDAARKGVLAAPVAILAALVLAGPSGAASAAFALGLVAANLVVAAAMLGWAASRSLGLVMGAALFGFALRLGGVALAVWAVRHHGWVHDLTLGITLIAGHLGLLLWEATSVSASLAFPALKPRKEHRL